MLLCSNCEEPSVASPSCQSLENETKQVVFAVSVRNALNTDTLRNNYSVFEVKIIKDKLLTTT